jgi:hypothetical protein
MLRFSIAGTMVLALMPATAVPAQADEPQYARLECVGLYCRIVPALTAPRPAAVDARPRAWCGWWLRHEVRRDPGPAFNLARKWVHWGYPARPAAGVVAVWPHHVGLITGRTAAGLWIVKSGNDRSAVRERPRSLAGAIAFRVEQRRARLSRAR